MKKYRFFNKDTIKKDEANPMPPINNAFLDPKIFAKGIELIWPKTMAKP